jgi:hypothetical protein
MEVNKMAFSYTKLAEIQYITTATGTVFTHSSGIAAKSYVRSITVHNSGVNTEDVRIYMVPDATGSVGVASTANEFYREKSFFTGN